MAITASKIISKAFLISGISAYNETPSGPEANDALDSLNRILGVFQLEQLLQYDDVTFSGTLVPGLNPHTIGPSGATFTAARPYTLLSAYIRDLSSNDYEMTIIDALEYDSIFLKNLQQNIPTYLFYNPKFPNGELYLSTVPNIAYTLHLRYKNPLLSFATLSTSNTYPDGYDQLIIYQLAWQLASEYGIPRPDLKSMLDEMKNTVKKNNWQSYALDYDSRMPLGDNFDTGFNFHNGLNGW